VQALLHDAGPRFRGASVRLSRGIPVHAGIPRPSKGTIAVTEADAGRPPLAAFVAWIGDAIRTTEMPGMQDGMQQHSSSPLSPGDPGSSRPSADVLQRVVAAMAALFCAAAVGLGAYAAHATGGLDQSRLQTASLYLFLHGLALLVLAPRRGAAVRLACVGLMLGVLVFSGSLTGAALAGWSTGFAPWGGTLLIASWLLLAGASMAGKHR